MLSFKSSRYLNVYPNSRHPFCIRIREHSNMYSYSSKNVVKSAIWIRSCPPGPAEYLVQCWVLSILRVRAHGDDALRRCRVQAHCRPPLQLRVCIHDDPSLDPIVPHLLPQLTSEIYCCFLWTDGWHAEDHGYQSRKYWIHVGVCLDVDIGRLDIELSSIPKQASIGNELQYQIRCLDAEMKLLVWIEWSPIPICRCFRPANLPRGYPR
jgi:hypothetical protein